MNGNAVQTTFFLALLAGVGLLTFFIFQPYLGAMFLALVLMIVFGPVNRCLLRILKGRATVSAGLTVLFAIFILLVPVSSVGTMLFQEASSLTKQISSTGAGVGFATDKMETVERYINNIIPGDTQIDLNSQEYLKDVASWVSGNLGSFFSGAAKFSLNFALMLFALFFFLKDGDKMKAVAMRWSPLADVYDEGILHKVSLAVNSVVKGAMLIAVIQGILAGIGFAVFGVPSPVLWGFVTSIAALIPSVGTIVVILPVVVYLYVMGSLGAAIGLLVYGVVIVGLIDNFLRPILIERGMKVHPFLILLSVFGGLAYFGPIGFVAGPIVLSFAFALIDVFPDVVHIDSGSGIVQSSSQMRAQGTSGPQGVRQKRPGGVVQLR